MFTHLICRTRFNRRRKRLQPYIVQVQEVVSKRLEGEGVARVVDSIPITVEKLAREKSFLAFGENFETASAKGYSAVNKGWFIGYKPHLILYENGGVQQSDLHDINFLKKVENLPIGRLLSGDRAYRSNPLQMNLFENYQVKLKVPFRINQYGYKKHPKKYKSKRQIFESFFVRMCEQLNLKRNYAKTFNGLLTRISSKFPALSILHWINHQSKRKIAQINLAWSFK